MEKSVNELELIYLSFKVPYMIFDEFVRLNIRLINKIINDSTSLSGKCYTYDDLYQEILVAIWYSFVHYRLDGGMRFSSYVYMVAKSRILRVLHRHQNSAYGFIDYSLPLDAPVIGDDGSMSLLDVVADNNFMYRPDKMMNVFHAQDWLWLFVKDWKECDIKIVMLRNEGYEYAEIAEIIGCNRKHVEYVLNKLRRGWNAYNKSYI